MRFLDCGKFQDSNFLGRRIQQTAGLHSHSRLKEFIRMMLAKFLTNMELQLGLDIIAPGL